MTGKQKATVAIIVIILIVLAFVLPDNDQMTAEEEALRSIGYQREKVIVPILTGIVVSIAAGYCIYTKIEDKRIEKEEKRRKENHEV